MKAAIYCRVSTEDQEREGTSLQTQLRRVGLTMHIFATISLPN